MDNINFIKNTLNYDYIIVGGGPTGMTLAWLLGSKNYKILILEKEEVLGGCNRVHRVNGYFSEHGPRVYSNSYLTFIELLKDMNLDFFHIFTEYKSLIDNPSFNNSEKKALLLAFIKLIFNPNYGKDISIQQYIENYNFTDNSKDYIQRLCRITDGAKSEDYTLFQFLQLMNQQFFYKLYQPKLPNDKGLIYLWEEKLKSTKNVDIIKSAKVIKLNKEDKKIISITVLIDGVINIITGKKFILTIPPKPLYHLLNSSPGVENAFGDLKEWKSRNSYIDYIPITFHYNEKIDLSKKYKYPKSPWGIVFIILSNYMVFENEPSQTVISLTITFTDRPNEYGKTVDQCSKEEIIDYVKEQLPYFPNPDKIIISPNVIRSNNKWINIDTAYVRKSLRPIDTLSDNFIDNNSKDINNLYAVGIYNGNTNYYFTSLESAVENAIEFSKNEIHDLKYQFTRPKHLDLTEIIYNIILIILYICVLYFVKKLFFNNNK